MNSEKIKMEVNIAGEMISLTVPFSRQEAVRNTEAELGALYRLWSEEFPGKSPSELLAMMAYRYASFYFDLKRTRDEEIEEAELLLEDAARLCGDSPADDSDSASDSGYPFD